MVSNFQMLQYRWKLQQNRVVKMGKYTGARSLIYQITLYQPLIKLEYKNIVLFTVKYLVLNTISAYLRPRH